LTINECFYPSLSVNQRITVPIRVGINVLVAEPISKIDGTRSPANRVLLLQMCPVTKLLHTQKDEFISKEVNCSQSFVSAKVE